MASAKLSCNLPGRQSRYYGADATSGSGGLALSSRHGRDTHRHHLARQARRDPASIVNYEKRLAQARADLSHINAAISIFEASGDPKGFPAYVDIHRLLKRGEAWGLCKQALVNGPRTTRQLALHIIKAKGFDVDDKVLAKSIGNRLIHVLRLQWKQGKLIAKGRDKAARIWELPPEKILL